MKAKKLKKLIQRPLKRENKLISNNKIPKYNTLLNNYTIQKIRENYKDDFI